MFQKTHLAKAVQAAAGKSTRELRGILDQASKNIVADRQILARIVKECVAEAKKYSVAELERLIPAEIQISAASVHREDAAADVGTVRQENTEDGTTSEGTVRFDILFELALPGSREPVLLIINVEVQNRRNLPYPLERRAMIYASRLVGRQGTDYAACRKVYSIWIVSGPQKKLNENTIVKLVAAKENRDGTLEKALPAAQVAEVWFLNLGDPQDKKLESSLLRMLDIVFSGSIDTAEKIHRLQQDHGLIMSVEISDNLKEMQNMELAIEARARDEGRMEGLMEGRMEATVETTIKTARALNASPASILSLLTANLGGSEQQARQELDAYLRKHPEEGRWLQGTAGAGRISLKDIRRSDKQHEDR